MRLLRACAPERVIQITVLAAWLLTLAACNQKTSGFTVASGSGRGANATTGGSKKAANSSSTEFDACTLVTKAEAEGVLGEHVKDAESLPVSTRGGESCMYESPDTLSARHVTVRIESPAFDWTKYKEDKRIEGERMQPKRGRIRPVPGLGKDAYFARHVLHVLTDKGVLTVIVFKDPKDAAAGEEVETPAESAEKILAQKAVARM